jgi:hypothetical protein
MRALSSQRLARRVVLVPMTPRSARHRAPAGRTRWSGLLAATCLGAAPLAGAAAQSVRVTGITTVQAVDLRPLVEDSVPIGQATGAGPYRELADGRLVRCVDGDAFCRFRRSGDRVTATPLVQDLRATAWGFGEGISAHAHLRARSSLGGTDFLWPRADDAFDALEAFLQLERERWRLRLGRQWATNGLGAYNFDGGSALWRRNRLHVEAFGGVSLVAGLNEPHAGGALGAIDDLPPDERGYLIGVRTGARLGDGGAASGTWQRVIRADRAGLYSERVAADVSIRALSTTIDAAFVYDLVGSATNEARLRATRPLPWRLATSVEVRRHRPFFEAWTIWGVFSPVAYDEARTTVDWRDRSDRVRLGARGAWRRYDETDAGLSTLPLRTDGWRAGVSADWSPADAWFWYADYDVDVGFGASRSDFTTGGRWTPDEAFFVGGTVTALQNIYEFRVGTGRVLGARLEGGARIARDARVVLDGAFYAHRLTNSAPTTDWSQRRVSLRFEWTLGRDPGEMSSEARARSP